MIIKAIKGFITIIGVVLGFVIYLFTKEGIYDFFKFNFEKNLYDVILSIFFIVLFGFIFFVIAPLLIREGKKIAIYIQNQILIIPLPELLMSVAGFIIAILVAYLLSNPVSKIPFLGIPLSILIYIFLGYIGINIGRIKKDELVKYINLKKVMPKERINKKTTQCLPKILYTSVIIDGRLSEIIETGFIEGKIIIPTFVLDELRYIADSSDDLKRIKGRRGLDILNDIQNSNKVVVEINDINIEDATEVDIKLLKLAEKLGGCVVTNDYNLNKVAQIKNIKILNINELSNAVKPKLVAGERLNLQIVKEGKEHSQGVGYLDDGTMIVVENGKKFVGSFVETEVSSILQTPAGRMIFAKIK